MYKVYCDSYLLYDDQLESLKIFEPKVNLELNSVGSFTFTIYPEHPYFGTLQKMKSIITVYQDGNIIFKGRILNEVNGFYNEKKVTCEGDLSFLLDSIQRPYDFKGTPADLFKKFIDNHNSQVDENHKFKIGTITVTDPNDYITRSDSTYQDTWKSIQNKLIDILGGYIWVRHEEDGTYIDYLADFDYLSSQDVEFGQNLIDIKRTVKANEIFTVIVPIGAMQKDEEGNETEKLTIKDVNDGKDYLVNEEAIALYGKIVKMVEWSDVTVASNLKTKGQKYLDEHVLLSNTIELSAADLSAMDKSFSSFHLGSYVKVKTQPHGIDSSFLVNKLSIDLLNPVNNKLSLGSAYMTMTDKQQSDFKVVMSQVDKKVETVVHVTTKEMSSSIQSSSTEILQTVSQTYYTKEEIPRVIEQQTSTMSQTVDGWEQTWKSFKQTYDSDKSGTDEKFEELEKYIRYVDGSIILGEVGNQIELKIKNDRIQFLQNNTEVAYFSNNRLYVVDAEFTNSLLLGNFAFLPRTNGNLSFKKVGD